MTGNIVELQKADWVRSLGAKGIARLQYEMGLMQQQYPQFDFHVDPGNRNCMYIEGYLITQFENSYQVRVYFTENYPYRPPLPIVMDADVVRERGTGRLPHNLGLQYGGVALCVIKPDDTVGQPWTPNLSSITMVKFAATWLHAYELWKQKGVWYLREA